MYVYVYVSSQYYIPSYVHLFWQIKLYFIKCVFSGTWSLNGELYLLIHPINKPTRRSKNTLYTGCNEKVVLNLFFYNECRKVIGNIIYCLTIHKAVVASTQMCHPDSQICRQCYKKWIESRYIQNKFLFQPKVIVSWKFSYP